MVTGQVGMNGVHVVSHVDLVYNNDLEIVTTQHLYMGAMTVLELVWKFKIVKRDHYVQVMHYFKSSQISYVKKGNFLLKAVLFLLVLLYPQ